MPGDGTPTFVQGSSDPYDQSSANWVTEEFFSLPEAPLSGNAVLVVINWNTNPNTTQLKDASGSNVGTQVLAPEQPGSNWWVEAWLVPNITSGNRRFSITTSHNNAMFECAPQSVEFYNIDQSAGSGAIDVIDAADDTGPNPRISITTSTNGCAILVFGWNADPEAAVGAFSAIDSSWRLLAQNRHNGICSAYKVQTTAGAISCGFDVAGATDWTLVAVALKPANAGTAPTKTPRVAFKQAELRNGTSASWVSQFTPFGACLVVETLSVDTGSGGSTLSSISDDQSNTWTQRAHSEGSTGGTADAFTCDSLTADEKIQLSITWASALDNVCHNFMAWDIIGGAYDTAAATDGQQTSSGNLSAGSVTPTTSTGMAFFLVGIDEQTIHEMVGAAFSRDHSYNDQADGSCGSAFSDNGAGHCDYSDTSALTAVWTDNAPSGVNFWGAVAVAIKQAGGTQTLAPSGISSGETFGASQVNLRLLAQAIASLEAFGAAALVPGAVSVSPSGIASSEAFGAAQLNLRLLAQALASAETFGDPTLVPGSVSIAPSGIASSEAFGDVVVTNGALIIAPAGIASLEAFGDALVLAGGVSILPSGIASAEAFGGHTVAPGSVVVLPSGIGTAEAFGGTVVVPGVRVLTPSGIDSAETFGAIVIVGGEQGIGHLYATLRVVATLRANASVRATLEGTARYAQTLKGTVKVNP